MIVAVYLLDDVHALDDLSEDDVLAVEPGGLDGADKELAAVGVGAGVGHGEDSGSGVLQLEVLVLKLVAVDGLSFVAAFCESASGYPKPEPSAAARVQASRMAKRTADLRAELAQQKANAS